MNPSACVLALALLSTVPMAVGVQTDATGIGSFGGGAFAQATNTGSVAIGGGGFGGGTVGASASGLHAVALGANTSAAFTNSSAIAKSVRLGSSFPRAAALDAVLTGFATTAGLS